MNSAVHFADPARETQAVDELLLWVAQRADQLAQKSEPGRQHDLDHWQQAEDEVLARLSPSELTPVA